MPIGATGRSVRNSRRLGARFTDVTTSLIWDSGWTGDGIGDMVYHSGRNELILTEGFGGDRVAQFDLSDNTLVDTYSYNLEIEGGLDISPDESEFAFARTDDEDMFTFVDADTFSVIEHVDKNDMNLSGDPGNTSGVRYDPQAEYIAFYYGTGDIHITDYDKTQEETSFSAASSIFETLWSPSGHRIAFSASSTRRGVYERDTWNELFFDEDEGAGRAVTWYKDNRLIMYNDGTDLLEVFDDDLVVIETIDASSRHLSSTDDLLMASDFSGVTDFVELENFEKLLNETTDVDGVRSVLLLENNIGYLTGDSGELYEYTLT